MWFKTWAAPSVAMIVALLTTLAVAAEECGTEQCDASQVATCGTWCRDGSTEACLVDASIMPCQGEYCRTTCQRWYRSILAAGSVTCQEFSDFAVYPRGGAICKEECLLPEIRKERYPSPTGLGLLCRPNSCDPAVQARYRVDQPLDSGLGALECPCNWFGSDCQDDWVPVQHIRKEVLGEFEVTYLNINKEAWQKVMKDYRPGSILRVQHLDQGGISREQPYALAGKGEEGVLEILTGPPPQGLNPVVVEVAHAVRQCAAKGADGAWGLFVNPVISGFFNGRYSFLMDGLQSVKQVAIVSSGVGLSGVKAAITELLPKGMGIHVFYGLRDVVNLPYKSFWQSLLAKKRVNLTLVVSGSSSGAPDLQDAVHKGSALLETARNSPNILESLRPHKSGKIYAQQAIALDFLAGGLADAGATLADTAVIICGRNELLLETPGLLQAGCQLDPAQCKALIEAHVFTNI